MDEKFCQLINNLEKRRDMFVFGKGYSPLVNYLLGYDERIYDIKGERPLSKHFQLWLQDYVSKRFNIGWEHYILNQMCNGDEKKAEETLFSLLKQYIEFVNKVGIL